MTWLDIAVIGFIICTIGWVALRTGQVNPEGTGVLGRKVAGVSAKMSLVETELTAVKRELDDLKQSSATTKDIERLEERIAGHREVSSMTNRSVERIERMLIEKGLGK